MHFYDGNMLPNPITIMQVITKFINQKLNIFHSRGTKCRVQANNNREPVVVRIIRHEAT